MTTTTTVLAIRHGMTPEERHAAEGEMAKALKSMFDAERAEEREACLDILAKEYHAALEANETQAHLRLADAIAHVVARRPR